MRAVFGLAVGLASFSAAGGGDAQTSPIASPPRPVWTVDWQESQCTISIGDARTTGLALWMTPGDPDPVLYIVGSPDALPRDIKNKLAVVLGPGGETYQAEVDHLSDASPTILKLRELRRTFPAAFSKANEVRLVAGSGALIIPVPGAGKAMTALQECIDKQLRDWGVDPKAFAGLRKAPTNDDYSIMSPNDYPAKALNREEQGRVVVRLQVSAAGRVTDCAVVVSSGSESLDSGTCKAALKKGRFDPAIGADGQPTAAPRMLNVKWTLE